MEPVHAAPSAARRSCQPEPAVAAATLTIAGRRLGPGQRAQLGLDHPPDPAQEPLTHWPTQATGKQSAPDHPRRPTATVASREDGAAAMAAKLSAAAVSGPPAKSGGQVRRTAALTLVIGLLRMSRLPSPWW